MCILIKTVKVRTLWEGHKIWTKSLLFWRLLGKSADLSKQVGVFFKSLLPFQNCWTLSNGFTKWQTIFFLQFLKQKLLTDFKDICCLPYLHIFHRSFQQLLNSCDSEIILSLVSCKTFKLQRNQMSRKESSCSLHTCTPIELPL